jgi:hypothetical protein
MHLEPAMTFASLSQLETSDVIVSMGINVCPGACLRPITVGASECICGATNDLRVWTAHEGYECLFLQPGQERVGGSEVQYPLLCIADGVDYTRDLIGRSSTKATPETGGKVLSKI